MTSERQKSCMVVAPGGADLSVLRSKLSAFGYHLAAPVSDIPGRPWLSVLVDAIDNVDLVVAVLPDSSSSVINTVFELAVAVSRGRRVLVLAAPGFDELPLALSALPVIRAEPNSAEAIDFALSALSERPSATVFGGNAVRTKTPLVANLAHEFSKRLHAATSESEVIGALSHLLRESGADVVSEARVGPRTVDVAVWADALESSIGNPLVIEVKWRIQNVAELQRALASLTNYVHASGAPWGLLLYAGNLPEDRLRAEVGSASRILAMSFAELLVGLEHGTIFDLLRRLRNLKVHGVER